MPGAGLGNEKGALLPNLPNIISKIKNIRAGTSSDGLPTHFERRKNLHPWVKVDQVFRPLPLKTLSILVGLA